MRPCRIAACCEHRASIPSYGPAGKSVKKKNSQKNKKKKNKKIRKKNHGPSLH